MKVKRNPEMGKASFVGGTREIAITATPDVVISEIRAEEILILAVVHGREDR
jgi:plasmid stabilization system protein ParE